jgi:hypothetical protein
MNDGMSDVRVHQGSDGKVASETQVENEEGLGRVRGAAHLNL